MRILKLSLAALLVTMILLVTAGLVWALNPSPPEQKELDAAMADPAISVQNVGEFVTLAPAGAVPKVGILFYPGLHVASEAYIFKLAAIVKATGVGIVIGRPPLSIAFFSIGQAEEMKPLLPSVTNWYVGGHSMGAAAACMFAAGYTKPLKGVLLLGSYCGSDLSNTDLKVLIVAGSRDGLFPPETIKGRLNELPPDATFRVIDGMNHAQFANYGPQFGDTASTISDGEALAKLAAAVAEIFR